MDVIINENVIFDDDEENTFDELFVKRATATPFWFALGVLMKVPMFSYKLNKLINVVSINC